MLSPCGLQREVKKDQLVKRPQQSARELQRSPCWSQHKASAANTHTHASSFWLDSTDKWDWKVEYCNLFTVIIPFYLFLMSFLQSICCCILAFTPPTKHYLLCYFNIVEQRQLEWKLDLIMRLNRWITSFSFSRPAWSWIPVRCSQSRTCNTESFSSKAQWPIWIQVTKMFYSKSFGNHVCLHQSQTTQRPRAPK